MSQVGGDDLPRPAKVRANTSAPSSRLPKPRGTQRPDPASAKLSGAIGPYRTLGTRWEHPLGRVSNALDTVSQRRMVVTLLHPVRSLTQAHLDACLASARIIAGVDDRGVVPLMDVIQHTDGRLALATNPVEGHTLGQVLANRRLAPARTIAILRQICHTLGQVHRAGIVHGALTIGGVILTGRAGRNDAVVLTDFGLQGIMDAEVQIPDADAAFQPVTPERILGLQRTSKEDIYLVGCLGYLMLTGAAPFRTGDSLAVQRRHAIEDPMPIEDRVAGHRVPPDVLTQVIHRCLAKDADERFDDMADLEAELCLAQIDAKLRTAWDDLPIPEVDGPRMRMIERGLRMLDAPISNTAAFNPPPPKSSVRPTSLPLPPEPVLDPGAPPNLGDPDHEPGSPRGRLSTTAVLAHPVSGDGAPPSLGATFPVADAKVDESEAVDVEVHTGGKLYAESVMANLQELAKQEHEFKAQKRRELEQQRQREKDEELDSVPIRLTDLPDEPLTQPRARARRRPAPPPPPKRTQRPRATAVVPPPPPQKPLHHRTDGEEAKPGPAPGPPPAPRPPRVGSKIDPARRTALGGLVPEPLRPIPIDVGKAPVTQSRAADKPRAPVRPQPIVPKPRAPRRSAVVPEPESEQAPTPRRGDKPKPPDAGHSPAAAKLAAVAAPEQPELKPLDSRSVSQTAEVDATPSQQAHTSSATAQAQDPTTPAKAEPADEPTGGADATAANTPSSSSPAAKPQRANQQTPANQQAAAPRPSAVGGAQFSKPTAPKAERNPLPTPAKPGIATSPVAASSAATSSAPANATSVGTAPADPPVETSVTSPEPKTESPAPSTVQDEKSGREPEPVVPLPTADGDSVAAATVAAEAAAAKAEPRETPVLEPARDPEVEPAERTPSRARAWMLYTTLVVAGIAAGVWGTMALQSSAQRAKATPTVAPEPAPTPAPPPPPATQIEPGPEPIPQPTPQPETPVAEEPKSPKPPQATPKDPAPRPPKPVAKPRPPRPTPTPNPPSKPRPADPTDAASAADLASQGDAAFNGGNYRKATTLFNKAVRKAPSDAKYRISLGDAYYRQGRYANAKKHYEKAQSLGHGSAAGRLAKVAAKMGE